MGKTLKLTSPIKVAGSMASVTADKLAEGQVAIYDDGTGALGIAGKAGGRLLRSPTGGNSGAQGKVPITPVTGPGYFAAPQGTIDPATDSMVFYTMGCRSRSINGETGDVRHITKKRYSRMGKTTATASSSTVWENKQQTTGTVEAALTHSEFSPSNATMDFFTADLSELEAELRRKFYITGNDDTDTMLNFNLGSRRRKGVVKYRANTGLLGRLEMVRCTIGMGIMRNGQLLTDIYAFNVLIYYVSTNGILINSASMFRTIWSGLITSGAVIKFAYTPVRRNGVEWEQPNPART